MDSIHIIRSIHWYFPCTGPLSCMWDLEVVCSFILFSSSSSLHQCPNSSMSNRTKHCIVTVPCVLITLNCLEKTMLHQQVTNQKNSLARVSLFFSWKTFPTLFCKQQQVRISLLHIEICCLLRVLQIKPFQKDLHSNLWFYNIYVWWHQSTVDSERNISLKALKLRSRYSETCQRV